MSTGSKTRLLLRCHFKTSNQKNFFSVSNEPNFCGVLGMKILGKNEMKYG